MRRLYVVPAGVANKLELYVGERMSISDRVVRPVMSPHRRPQVLNVEQETRLESAEALYHLHLHGNGNEMMMKPSSLGLRPHRHRC